MQITIYVKNIKIGWRNIINFMHSSTRKETTSITIWFGIGRNMEPISVLVTSYASDIV